MQDIKQIIQQTAQVQGQEITITDNPTLPDDGVYYQYRNEIEIRPVEQMLDSFATTDEKTKRYKEVMRHELVHAFFALSGLDDYSGDEVLVDWIATMFPRLYKTFVECNCED